MQVARIQPAYDGVDTHSSPDYLDATKAPVVENLLGRPGKLVMRGPLRRSADLSIGGPVLRPGVAWTTGDSIMYVFTDGTRKSISLPFMGITNLANTNPIELRAPHSETLIPVAGSPFVYGIGFNTEKRVYGWSVAAGGLVDFSVGSIGPRGDFLTDIKVHLQRLFVLGGIPAGGGIDRPNVLFYSDPGGAATAALGFWQDDVSGLTNQLVFDAAGELPIALASVGRNLAILMNRSIHLLVGDAPSNWVVRKLSSTYGCAKREGVVEAEDGIYFMDYRSGFVYTDGSTFRTVSGPVQPELLAALPDGDFATMIYTARLPNDYIFVYVRPSIMDSFQRPTFSYLFHAPTGTWFKFSCDATISGLDLASTGAIGNTAKFPFLIDGALRLYLMDEVSLPEIALAANRGFDNKAGVTARIPAKWYSRLVKLSSPSQVSMISRLLLDYAWVPDGAAVEGQGWSASLIDGQGRTLLPATTVPGQIDPPVQLQRVRYQKEIPAEATDVQLRVEYAAGAAAAIEKAEIYDATLEYEPARNRPRA